MTDLHHAIDVQRRNKEHVDIQMQMIIEEIKGVQNLPNTRKETEEKQNERPTIAQLQAARHQLEDDCQRIERHLEALTRELHTEQSRVRHRFHGRNRKDLASMDRFLQRWMSHSDEICYGKTLEKLAIVFDVEVPKAYVKSLFFSGPLRSFFAINRPPIWTPI